MDPPNSEPGAFWASDELEAREELLREAAAAGMTTHVHQGRKRQHENEDDEGEAQKNENTEDENEDDEGEAQKTDKTTETVEAMEPPGAWPIVNVLNC